MLVENHESVFLEVSPRYRLDTVLDLLFGKRIKTLSDGRLKVYPGRRLVLNGRYTHASECG